MRLGGPIGSGAQWMSWVSREDLVRLIAFTMTNPEIEGSLNATAPEPVRNIAFATALGRALGRWAFMPLPALPLEIALGDFARELLLTGQQVVPDRAREAGFRFRHATIESALRAELPSVHAELRTHSRAVKLEAGAEAR